MSTDLIPGMHLISPRQGYTHHGIYVGNGQVIHYSGYSHGFHRGPVSEVSVEDFSKGHGIAICRNSARFSAEEIVRRARSRLAENSYQLLSNNCEHFCSWCITGRHHSEQVENLLSFPEKLFGPVYRNLTGLLLQAFHINLSGGNYPKQETSPFH